MWREEGEASALRSIHLKLCMALSKYAFLTERTVDDPLKKDASPAARWTSSPVVTSLYAWTIFLSLTSGSDLPEVSPLKVRRTDSPLHVCYSGL